MYWWLYATAHAIAHAITSQLTASEACCCCCCCCFRGSTALSPLWLTVSQTYNQRLQHNSVVQHASDRLIQYEFDNAADFRPVRWPARLCRMRTLVKMRFSQPQSCWKSFCKTVEAAWTTTCLSTCRQALDTLATAILSLSCSLCGT